MSQTYVTLSKNDRDDPTRGRDHARARSRPLTPERIETAARILASVELEDDASGQPAQAPALTYDRLRTFGTFACAST